MRSIVLIAHDIRSCHNIGSLLRTAEGFGVTKVYLTGYSPYPIAKNDQRLPHIAQHNDRQIHKTALGTEHLVSWHHLDAIDALLSNLRKEDYRLVALEQAPQAQPLETFRPGQKIALLLGREVEGVDPKYLEQVDHILEIPMYGKKESFNVVQAAAIALYQLRVA
jgi:tRNA G18 (ribose-2'-O)-methylase SpoU